MAAAAAASPSVAASACKAALPASDSRLHPQELLLSAPGPYGHALLKGSILVGNLLRLEVRLTVPVPLGANPPAGADDFAPGTGRNKTRATATCSPSSSKGGEKPTTIPAVLHISGFQCTAAQYAPLAERLATHGYACVQYTLPRVAGVTRLVPDEQELAAAGDVWRWAVDKAAAGVGGGGGGGGVVLDEARVTVAGHSRGGKLAAILYARQWTEEQVEEQGEEEKTTARRRVCPWSRRPPPPADPSSSSSPPPSVSALPRLRALFLADPVDNTAALARRGYPSGVAALRAARRAAQEATAAAVRPPPTFALACAGRFGGGNPMGSNWLEFLGVAPPGARSLLLHNAGHATFLQLPADGSAGARAIDWLFGGGTAPRPVVMALTAGWLLAWLRREVLADTSAEADAEEARWLAAVARAGGTGEEEEEGKAQDDDDYDLGDEAVGRVQVSAEVKLGGQEDVEEADGDVVAAQVVSTNEKMGREVVIV
jgi:hypothetical protein